MELIVGLDISTTTIGYSFLTIDDNSKISSAKCFYYKPKKELPIIEMLYCVKKDLMQIIINETDKHQDCKIHISVEDIILFMKGHSTATTITALSAINRLLCVSLYEVFENINLINVNTVRSCLKKELGTKEKIDKSQVADTIQTIIRANGLPDWKFDFELNRNGKSKVENEDKADGLAVSICYYLKNWKYDEKKRSVPNPKRATKCKRARSKKGIQEASS